MQKCKRQIPLIIIITTTKFRPCEIIFTQIFSLNSFVEKKCKQIISVNLPKQSLVTTKLSAHFCCNFPGSRGSKTLQTSSMSQMLIRFLQFPLLQQSITMNLNTIFFSFCPNVKMKNMFHVLAYKQRQTPPLPGRLTRGVNRNFLSCSLQSV